MAFEVFASRNSSLALKTMVLSACSCLQFLPKRILVDLSTVGKFFTIYITLDFIYTNN